MAELTHEGWSIRKVLARILRIKWKEFELEAVAEDIWSEIEFHAWWDIFEFCILGRSWKKGEAAVWIRNARAEMEEVGRTVRAEVIVTLASYNEEGRVRKLDEKGVHAIQMVSRKAVVKAMELYVKADIACEQSLGVPVMTRGLILKIFAMIRDLLSPITMKGMAGPNDSQKGAGQQSLVYAIMVSAVALLLLVYHYLAGHVDRGGTKTYSRGAFGFRSTYVSIVLFLGAYIWIKFRDVASRKCSCARNKYTATLRRQMKGDIKNIYIRLGSFETPEEAKTNEEIAAIIWSGMQGQLTLDDGRSFSIPIPPDRPDTTPVPPEELDRLRVVMVEWVKIKVFEVYEAFKMFRVSSYASAAPHEDSQANAGHHEPLLVEQFEPNFNQEDFSELLESFEIPDPSKLHLLESHSQGVKTDVRYNRLASPLLNQPFVASSLSSEPENTRYVVHETSCGSPHLAGGSTNDHASEHPQDFSVIPTLQQRSSFIVDREAYVQWLLEQNSIYKDELEERDRRDEERNRRDEERDRRDEERDERDEDRDKRDEDRDKRDEDRDRREEDRDKRDEDRDRREEDRDRREERDRRDEEQDKREEERDRRNEERDERDNKRDKSDREQDKRDRERDKRDRERDKRDRERGKRERERDKRERERGKREAKRDRRDAN